MKKTFLILSFLLLVVPLVFALPAQQKTTLTWDAPATNSDGSPLTDLAGYKVYWSTKAGVYDNGNVKDVGNVLTVNIGSAAGQLKGTYFFVVTAYNTVGNESAFSNEVSASFFLVPAAPKNLR